MCGNINLSKWTKKIYQSQQICFRFKRFFFLSNLIWVLFHSVHEKTAPKDVWLSRSLNDLTIASGHLYNGLHLYNFLALFCCYFLYEISAETNCISFQEWALLQLYDGHIGQKPKIERALWQSNESWEIKSSLVTNTMIKSMTL